MTLPSGRRLLVAVLLASLTGCSFQGSISAADGTTPSSSQAGAATGGDTSAPSTSSPVTGTTGSPATAAAGTGTTGLPRCHTGDLAARLQPGSPGAGQRYATLSLQNVGDVTCTVTGYGGLGLVDASGAPLPTRQVRVPAPAPTTTTLRPGDSVSALLHWSAVTGDGDAASGDCQPTAAALQVIPPDETRPLSVPWTFGPVCEGGTIDQQAYAAA